MCSHTRIYKKPKQIKQTVEMYQILVFLKTIFMVKKALTEEADSSVNVFSCIYHSRRRRSKKNLY